MGNVATVAQVMRPDGIVVEYNYPVQVAMLMALHPDYMVIQSPIGPVASGERRDVKVMELEDRLALGKSYLMYPIPAQYIDSFNERPPQAERQFKATRCQDLKLTLATKFRTRKNAVEKGPRRKRSLWFRVKVTENKSESDCFKLTSGGLETQKEGPDRSEGEATYLQTESSRTATLG